jgi:uncharacterized membrane protein YedE/YeeE
MNHRVDDGWSPYLAGALSGLVLVLSVLIASKYFGASTSFVRSAGMIEELIAPERVSQLAYFKSKTPKIDWQWMFVFGIFLGSLISSTTSSSFRLQAVPDMWKSRFGSGVGKRAIVAFLGAVVAMFGARLAGGCPSGHGLSGSAQLAVSGYIALICFFAGGLVVARILYSGR